MDFLLLSQARYLKGPSTGVVHPKDARFQSPRPAPPQTPDVLVIPEKESGAEKR